jgi:hypothetical protein
MNWFYVHEGQRVGPVSDVGLEDKVREGVVTATTLVWREGMAEWKPWAEVMPPGGLAAAGGTCVECGRAHAAEDMVELLGGKVCAACKPIRLQRIREGAPVGGPCTAFAEGLHVVVLQGGELPDRCICCNAPATRKVRRTFYWYPPWVNLLILIGVLPALVAVLVLQKRMRLEVTLCGEHRRRRRWRLLLSATWAAGSVALVPALVPALRTIFGSGWGGVGSFVPAMFLVSIVSFLAALWWSQRVAMILRPVRITRDAGCFAGAGKEFLASLPAGDGSKAV